MNNSSLQQSNHVHKLSLRLINVSTRQK